MVYKLTLNVLAVLLGAILIVLFIREGAATVYEVLALVVILGATYIALCIHERKKKREDGEHG